MDVLPVMDTKIVINSFFRQSNQLGKLTALALVVLILSGCQNPMSDAPVKLGYEFDVTEDLYHHLKAGLFEPEKDPMICRVIKKPNLYEKLKLPFYSKNAPHKMVRVSWERGSFWVESDDHALVVIYMDPEATFSHVQIATLEGFSLARIFREKNEVPVR